MKLSDQIWWTRKTRIQAASRLQQNSLRFEILLAWYSFWSVASSIYFLSNTPSSNTPLVASTIFAVLVLILSLIVSNINLKPRALTMKTCYLQLERLYQEAKGIEDTTSEDSIKTQPIQERYQDIIESSENHSEFDHYYTIVKLTLSGEEIDKKPTGYIYARVAFGLITSYCAWAIVYIFPSALFYWLISIA